MAQAQCPASCGELIQGWIGGSEKLVSCPVDWFSSVTVRDGHGGNARPLMRAAAARVLTLAGFSPDDVRGLSITVDSTIPLAKGMASSTADIAATAQATARHLGQPLSADAIADLCVGLEPSDSTVFAPLTLFDHNDGHYRQPCGNAPALDILLLESPDTLLTADYHRRERQAALLANAPMLEHAWQLIQRACEVNCPRLIGEAATLSATASQAILPKPGFASLLKVVERFDLFGLNVAHSGSVIGLMLDRERHDVERIIATVQGGEGKRQWPRTHLLRLVNGGVR